MTKSTRILVACHELIGGVAKRGGEIETLTVEAGKEIDADALKALGLKKDDIPGLVAKGAVKEVDARLAAGAGDPEVAELKEQLEAANKRAEEAEARAAAKDAGTGQDQGGEQDQAGDAKA